MCSLTPPPPPPPVVGVALISWQTRNLESALKEVVNMTVCQLFPSNASRVYYNDNFRKSVQTIILFLPNARYRIS